MGIRKKEHRKKVELRNQKIKGAKNAMQRLFDETMKKQIEELKKKQELSGQTENQN
jgi:hypothetical protein